MERKFGVSQKPIQTPGNFDTICNATWARQQEAEDLSQMRHCCCHWRSSFFQYPKAGTGRRKTHARAVTVETASELGRNGLQMLKQGGQPGLQRHRLLLRRFNSMSAETNDNMSFEEMLNASEEKRVHAGSIVKGIVTSISPTRSRWISVRSRPALAAERADR